MLAVDAEIRRLCGYCAEDFTAGRVSWMTLIHGTDRDRVRRALQHAAVAGRAYQVEYRLCHRDGGERPVREQGQRLLDDQGQVVGFSGFLADASANERHRRWSAEQAQRARALLQALPCATYTIDLDGRITFYNEQAVALWGQRPRLGDEDRLFCGSLRLRWPDGCVLRHDDSPMARTVRDGVGYRNQEVILERPDGSHVHVLVSIDPLHDAAGGLCGAVNAFVDITGRRHAQAALRASEERFRRLADALPQLVWTAQPNGVVDYYNDRVNQYAGIRRGAEGDWTWQPVLHPEDREVTLTAWRHAVGSGQTYQCEHRVRMSDGAMRWHLSRALPVRDDEDRIVRWFGTATDIHDIKQAQEALREADQRKNRFVATLAHELRNPLAPIRNAVGLLQMAESLPAPAMAACDIIDRQSQHLTRLVDDLLDMSRITRDRMQLRRKTVSLGSVVDHAREAIATQTEARGQQLRVHLPAAPVTLDADPARLAQVLVNLLDNASKYTGPGGEIELSARVADDAVRVDVKDTGIGIAAEDLPQLFETFAPVGDQPGRGGAGLGLGLALSRRLVEMHGGTIEASSEGPDRGAVFSVRLPVRQVEAQPPAPSASAGGAAERSALSQPASSSTEPLAEAAPSVTAEAPAKTHVLVADDNPDIVESLSMLLDASGYAVTMARDGIEAVAAAEREQLDIVLLDIGMPNLDGHEACRRIRELPDGERLNVFALTGWGQAEDREKSAAAGFDGHLVKPIEPGELLKRLREIDAS